MKGFKEKILVYWRAHPQCTRQECADAVGCSRTRVSDVIKEAISSGDEEEHKPSQARRDAILEYWLNHPQCTWQECANAFGCSCWLVALTLREARARGDTEGHIHKGEKSARHPAILEYWLNHPWCTPQECADALGYTSSQVSATVRTAVINGKTDETVQRHRARRAELLDVSYCDIVKKITALYRDGVELDVATLDSLAPDRELVTKAYIHLQHNKKKIRARLYERAKQLFIDDPDALAVNVAAVLKFNPNVDADEIAKLMGISYQTADFALQMTEEISPRPRNARWLDLLKDWNADHRTPPPGYDAYLKEVSEWGGLGVKLFDDEWERYQTLYRLRRQGYSRDECDRLLGITRGENDESKNRSRND